MALCRLTNLLFASVGCSVAVLDEEAGELRYLASSGPGADVVIGMRLALSAGIAGFVASTGQAMVVGDARRDPRFAEAVARRTGHVPTTLLVVPVLGADDEVVGVLTILDRGTDRPDDLDRAGDLAEIAAGLLSGQSGRAEVVSTAALEALDPTRRAATVRALGAVMTLAGQDQT